MVEILQADGSVRYGRVLEAEGKKALVQLFESAQGLRISNSRARFLGHGLELAVSPDMIGRVFDGMGEPIDGGPAVIAEKTHEHQRYADEPGGARLPCRIYPNGHFRHRRPQYARARAETADFSPGSGLPHKELAAQIARQAKVRGAQEEFAVVFAAMGITFEEAEFFIEDFRRTGAIEHATLFLNLADDPAVERISTPRMAITCAEYLAYELGMHVLVILTDITNYAEAPARGLGRAQGSPGPARLPGVSLHGPCVPVRARRRIKRQKRVDHADPILTMPEDDKTHPIRI